MKCVRGLKPETNFKFKVTCFPWRSESRNRRYRNQWHKAVPTSKIFVVKGRRSGIFLKSQLRLSLDNRSRFQDQPHKQWIGGNSIQPSTTTPVEKTITSSSSQQQEVVLPLAELGKVLTYVEFVEHVLRVCVTSLWVLLLPTTVK